MAKTLTRWRRPRSRVSSISSIGPTGRLFFRSSITSIRASAVPGEVAAARTAASHCSRRLTRGSVSPRTCSPTERPRPISGRWKSSVSSGQRRTIYSPQRGKRHSGLSRLRRRRRVGRPGGRSGDGNYLCELERNGLDRRSRAQHGGEQRSGYLPEPVRRLPWRKNDGLAASDSCRLREWEIACTPQQITATIAAGKGRMPGFPNLSDDQISALVTYLTSGESKETQRRRAITCPREISFHGISQVSGSRRISRQSCRRGER